MKTKIALVLIILVVLIGFVGVGTVYACKPEPTKTVQPTEVITEVPTETVANTPVNTLTDVPTEVVTEVPTETATEIVTETIANTSEFTPTQTEEYATKTPVYTPTMTKTIFSLVVVTTTKHPTAISTVSPPEHNNEEQVLPVTGADYSLVFGFILSALIGLWLIFVGRNK